MSHIGDVWSLTDDKLDRALAKLNEIEPYITKWSAGGAAPQLLINREYAMAGAFDGRLIAAIRQGAPISFVWERIYVTYTYMTVQKGGPNTGNAQRLIVFLKRAQIVAGWRQGTGPGQNTNQLKYLLAELIPQVSVNSQNASKCIIDDANWLAEMPPDGKTNADHIQERWLAWRTR